MTVCPILPMPQNQPFLRLEDLCQFAACQPYKNGPSSKQKTGRKNFDQCAKDAPKTLVQLFGRFGLLGFFIDLLLQGIAIFTVYPPLK